MPLNREQITLAGLAAGGEQASYTPVQIQKLFFLIDTEAAGFVGGPHFTFKPYNYGPFDRTVYTAVDALSAKGLAHVISTGWQREYALSPAGFQAGSQVLAAIPEAGRKYLQEAANWVRHLSFQQLVSAIYKKYPDMKKNSVFQE